MLEDVENVDLICVPDIMLESVDASHKDLVNFQQTVLDHCKKMRDRFAILDSYPAGKWKEISTIPIDNVKYFANNQVKPRGSEGAFYFPWVRVKEFATSAENSKSERGASFEVNDGCVRLVPPCGHVAGVYTRTDAQNGVHKPPANAILEEVLGLEVAISNSNQAELNDAGINCLRNFSRRGIRVWGARTLSGQWNYRYVHTKRIIVDLGSMG